MKTNLSQSGHNLSRGLTSPLSPVSLLLPQSDLVGDGGRDLGGHLVGGHHVHVEESDDLVSCDASPDIRVKKLKLQITGLTHLKACRQESLEIMPTQRFGNL